MNKRQKERLLKLADFLEYQVPVRNFNLRTVVGLRATEGYWPTYLDKESRSSIIEELKQIKDNIRPEKSCGAAACAVGWMPAVFPRLVKWDESSTVVEFVDKDKEVEYWSDVPKDVFGISNEQADYLFSPTSYRPDHRGPKSVANRIRKFVDNDGKLPSRLTEYDY